MIPQEPSVASIMGNALHTAIDHFASKIIDMNMEKLMASGENATTDSGVINVEELKSQLLNEMSVIVQEELKSRRSLYLAFLLERQKSNLVLRQTEQQSSEDSPGTQTRDVMKTSWSNYQNFDMEKKHEEGMRILTQFMQRELDQGVLHYLTRREAGTTSKINGKRHKDNGDDSSDTYHQIVRYPVLSEEQFQFETKLLNGEGERITFRGVWDRIDKMTICMNNASVDAGEQSQQQQEQGQVLTEETTSDVIVEFKTKLYPNASEQHLLQIVLYMYAHERIFGKLPEKAMLCSITNGETITWELDELLPHIQSAEELIMDVSENIRLQRFHATPATMKCNMCPFRNICDNRRYPPTTAGKKTKGPQHHHQHQISSSEQKNLN